MPYTERVKVENQAKTLSLLLLEVYGTATQKMKSRKLHVIQ
jgi:hypothetical protein